MEMTEEALRLCIKRKEWCDEPKLNERLYLCHKGFAEIRNLEPFTEVKELHLQDNALKEISNLNSQCHLQALYLQNNIIEKIENLDHCVNLKYINISCNNISMIDNLSQLKNLETLLIRQNNLTKPESIANITSAPKLRELDLGSNKISCAHERILGILSQCKCLHILTLKGNPITKRIPHYRKSIVSKCRKLTCLDGRKLWEEERRRCNAWGDVVWNGGSFNEADEADRQELMKMRGEQSLKNALKRSTQWEQLTVGKGKTHLMLTGIPKTPDLLPGSIFESVKKAFGFVESRASSSFISWSSRRSTISSACYSARSSIHSRKLSQESVEIFEDTDGCIRQVKQPVNPFAEVDEGSRAKRDSTSLSSRRRSDATVGGDSRAAGRTESSTSSTKRSSFENISVEDTFIMTDADLLVLTFSSREQSNVLENLKRRSPEEQYPTYSLFPPPPPPPTLSRTSI